MNVCVWLWMGICLPPFPPFLSVILRPWEVKDSWRIIWLFVEIERPHSQQRDYLCIYMFVYVCVRGLLQEADRGISVSAHDIEETHGQLHALTQFGFH